MNKKLKELIAHREELTVRLNAIADAAEAREDKAMTDEERAERDVLLRELSITDMRIASLNVQPKSAGEASRAQQMDNFLREAMSSGKKSQMTLQRESMLTTDVAPVIPLTIEDVVRPLEQGLILGRLGLPVRTGLAGDYCWPFVSAIEASIAGENVELTDSEISLTKLQPKPVRLGVTVKMTNQAINQTRGVLYDVVREQIGQALVRTLNRAMFCPEQYNADFTGPFSAAKTKVTFAGETPTLKELLSLKGKVLETGVDPGNGTMCYVMSESMKAVLEATPTEAGGGRMIVENNAIQGYPVFCTNYINMKAAGGATEVQHVGFGIWGYEPLGQFGEMRLIVDPYTGATSDTVRITLNGDWSMTTLRPEAFALGTATAAGE